MPARIFIILGLLILIAASPSCGLIKAPFKIAGNLTRTGVEASVKIYKKSEKKIAKRKKAREKKKAEEQQQDGSTEGAPPELEADFLPDLPPENLPPPNEMQEPAPLPEPPLPERGTLMELPGY